MPDIMHLVIAALAVGGTIIALFSMRKGKKSDKVEIEGLLSSALLEQHASKFEEALQNYDRARMLLEFPENRDEAKLASCLIHLAELYEKTGNFAAAKEMHNKLIRLWEKQLKSLDETTLIDIDFAMTHNEFGSGTSQVIDFYDKVVAVKEKRFGERSSEVADSYLIMAKLLRVIGEKESADLAEQRAAEIRPKPNRS
ncbi:MAG: tetratricopeptide repeat protein [Candidatus Melainabacteria bacterium]|jgi:tetratricopeptide (TPR) repeat protein|nr:tetratricopeptide repeat protein [Candidatus Melainabacteria bacterium]